MVKQARWGILATGGIAKSFTRDLLLTGHTVTAVGSRSLDKAQAFAGQFGIANVHDSYEALVADPEVDVVYIATPHPMHADNAILALEAGKHVLIEKPFTLNAQEAQAVVDVARRHKLVVMEAMWTRFLPHMVRIQDIVTSGVLGEIRTVIAEHNQDLPDDPAHRLNDLALGGGALLDLGIYPVWFACHILGAPIDVQAAARFRPTGADAETAMVCRHANDAISMTIATSDTSGSNTARILGTEGRIEIDGVWYMPTSFRVYGAGNTLIEEFTSSVEGRGMHFEADEMESLIAAGRTESLALPPDATVAVMQTLDRIRAQTGLRYPSENLA